MPPIPISDEKAKQLADKIRAAYAETLFQQTQKDYAKYAQNSTVKRVIQSHNQLIESVRRVQDELLELERDQFQEAALECIPFDMVYANVEKLQAEAHSGEKKDASLKDFEHEDFLVKEVLRWFKEDFFTWVNKCPCPSCGNADQNMLQQLGASAPTQEERVEGGASHTELLKCLKCNGHHRFPRYNNAKMLLKSRRGRCGEYAKCFYLILRSLGITTRYVWNREDHVWTEYYSHKFRKWIHLDSCENAFNEPLLYCNNWGKKMSYVIGVWVYGFVDLSNKYIDQRDKSKQLPRNALRDDELAVTLKYLDLASKRVITDKQKLYEIRVMDNREKKELHDFDVLYSGDLNKSVATVGRISGSDEWKRGRGETQK